MRDAPVVAVPDSLHNLLKYPLGLCLVQPPIRLALQITVQRSSPNILHHKDHILGCVNDLIESNDMLVLHLLHEFDLPLDALAPVRVHQLVFLVDFHSNFLVARFVQTDSDDSVGPLSNLLAYDILVQVVLVAEDDAVVGRGRCGRLRRLFWGLLGLVWIIMLLLALSALLLGSCLLLIVLALPLAHG